MKLNSEQCPDSEISMTFLQGMINRMAISYHKYGKVKDAFPLKIDALATMREKVKKYRETGNKEYLIDAANYLMIEFMCPSMDNTHFTPTDSTGSAGRIDVDGKKRIGISNEDLYESS